MDVKSYAVHKIKDHSDHDWGTKEPANKKKVDKVETYMILIEEPNMSDFGRGTIIDIKDRLEICQKIYTPKFSGERILHTENA